MLLHLDVCEGSYVLRSCKQQVTLCVRIVTGKCHKLGKILERNYYKIIADFLFRSFHYIDTTSGRGV